MRAVVGESYASVFRQGVSLLVCEGETVAPRGRATHELQQVSMTLKSPRRRYPNIPGRNANIFALVAETLWVLGGRNDLAFIKAYLPRMADYSLNGTDLSGGYGPRMRSWRGVDQLSHVISTLQRDRASRRAVITLYDSAIDSTAENLDVPCCNMLQFITREDRLNLFVFSRSMDIMWGSAINFFEWTTLQEAVAYWLGVDIGEYCHCVGSLHIYDEFLTRAAKIMVQEETEVVESPSFDLPFEILDDALATTFKAEAMFRNGDTDYATENYGSKWLAEVISLLRTFWIAKTQGDYASAARLIREQPITTAMTMALDQLAYMERVNA